MLKIITKSENDFLLRPSLDEVFKDEEELNFYFVSLILEESKDIIDIKVKETAYKYFINSDAVWYLKTAEEFTYLKIVLSEFETNSITEEYLNNLIVINEDRINEIYG